MDLAARLRARSACLSRGGRSLLRRLVSVAPIQSSPRSKSVRSIAAGSCACCIRMPDASVADDDPCSEEDVSGGFGRESDADHLLVTVNGLAGNPDDWKFAAEQFVQRLPEKVVVYRSKANTSKLTHDGIDIMGERLANEVRSIVKDRTNLRKISFLSHSLGGLIARYAIGKLYEPFRGNDSSVNVEDHLDQGKLEGTIAGLEPVNFITSGTPHLGSRWNGQLPFLCGIPFMERLASVTAHHIVGRTGKHLFLTDSEDGELPLLLQMVEDNDKIKFMSALHSFKRRVAYANINYDHIVGWRTSSIRHQHELPNHRLLAHDKKYPHIVHMEKQRHVKRLEDMLAKADEEQSMEAMMIKGLMQVNWERVDVCFHRSWLRYNAHNNIQVRSFSMNSHGEDVIFHIIDNFLL